MVYISMILGNRITTNWQIFTEASVQEIITRKDNVREATNKINDIWLGD